jgi:hypothetical protein
MPATIDGMPTRTTPPPPPPEDADDRQHNMTVRMPAGLARRIQRIAEREDRSANAQVLRWVRLAVEQAEADLATD